jgi:RNA polymerase sigma-70 factor (ECF subfamily)
MPSPAPDQAAAFAAFMHDHQDMVYSTAVRILADEAQAEDISQNVFLKAFERFDELRASPTTPGWLKTVATHMAINHLQRYRRRWQFFGERERTEEGGEPDDLPELAVPDQLLEGVSGAQRQAWVEAALRRLPDHQRVPLALYHFEELSYQQVAERLQVSVAKVKTDIFRGRAALLRQFGPHAATADLIAG